MLGMTDSAPASASRSRSIAAGIANLRPWQAGQSGNPNGRPPAPVDIAALAREHGPRCIEVAAELLEDTDPRIRLATLVALLDRGYGRPIQAIATQDNALSLTFLHLIAARASSEEINAIYRQVINGEVVAPEFDADNATAAMPVDLMAPALE